MKTIRYGRLTLASLAIVVACMSTATAQVSLRPRVSPETQQTYRSQSTTTQILSVAGMDVETKSTQFTISDHKTGPRAADGTIRVTEQVRKLQQEINLPGISVTFDSDNPDKKAALPQLESILDVLRVIAKLKVTFVYNKSGKLTKVEGVDALLASLKPELRKTRASQFSAETLLRQRKDQSDRILDKPVRNGDQWKHTSVLDLEAGQKLTITREYTYAGPTRQGDRTLQKITVKAVAITLTQDPPEGTPTKISDSKLKVAKSSGEILIDPKRGVIVSENSSLQTKGTLTLEINGQKLPAALDLTLQSKSKLGE
ncbi:MAG: hypothetical protein CMJ65_04625 [Planctomycetaceae bacterium]|jgi:uncharacterized protein YccT (UPF0319 family)|nr:hypothetical protein [Planctomycetaceae bacterium]